MTNIRLSRLPPTRRLFTGIWHQKIALVRSALRAGADVDARDDEGRSALHALVFRDRLIRETVLEKKPYLEVVDSSGETPLISAVMKDHPEYAIDLINAGANIYAKSCEGESCLQIALDRGHAQLSERIQVREAEDLRCRLERDTPYVMANCGQSGSGLTIPKRPARL